LFGEAAKKTGLGKAYRAVREAITTAIGLGANEVANKATAEQKKPSAEKTKKSNTIRLRFEKS
jgi:L-aminopeptidase/D-esterase-like protein